VSQQLKILPWGNEPLNDYLEKTDIAFCYHPKMIPHYLPTALAIGAAANVEKKNVDLFVAGDYHTIQTQLNSRRFIKRMKQFHFSHVEFINLSHNRNEPWLHQPGLPNRTYRIFYQERFSHQVVKQLLKLSQLSGCTGDQSLSEALSAGVFPIYSAMPHKIALLENLIVSIAAVNINIASLVSDLSSMRSFPNIDEEDYLNHIEKFGALLGKNKTQTDFAQCSQFIRKQADFSKQLFKGIDTQLGYDQVEDQQKHFSFTRFFTRKKADIPGPKPEDSSPSEKLFKKR